VAGLFAGLLTDVNAVDGAIDPRYVLAGHLGNLVADCLLDLTAGLGQLDPEVEKDPDLDLVIAAFIHADPHAAFAFLFAEHVGDSLEPATADGMNSRNAHRGNANDVCDDGVIDPNFPEGLLLLGGKRDG